MGFLYGFTGGRRRTRTKNDLAKNSKYKTPDTDDNTRASTPTFSIVANGSSTVHSCCCLVKKKHPEHQTKPHATSNGRHHEVPKIVIGGTRSSVGEDKCTDSNCSTIATEQVSSLLYDRPVEIYIKNELSSMSMNLRHSTFRTLMNHINIDSQPSEQPTRQPTRQPTTQPSAQPTIQPSGNNALIPLYPNLIFA